MHLRNPEHGHHGVPDELLHGAAVTLERRLGEREPAGHDAAERFRIESLAESGRADDIGEEDRHGLSHLTGHPASV